MHDKRGPWTVDETTISRECPTISSQIVRTILDGVLSHPPTGANQRFSRPTDAPIPDDPILKDSRHDFFLRPLLSSSNRTFTLLDRSICSPAFIKALFTALRAEHKDFDKKVGLAIERFLRLELTAHGISTIAGNYKAGSDHGECDCVIETDNVVMFAEVKKKGLTRRAQAGSDAHLLLDLAGSLLEAQSQAGWHEVRLRQLGYLDVDQDGSSVRLDLRGREVERIAISLFDFGSFQDRILLKQFLEATMNVTFTPKSSGFQKKFGEINKSLQEIRDQITNLHPGKR